jgi:hypothetical protein
MLYRALLFVTVVVAITSLIFQSIPAALAAGVIGVFAVTARSLDR